MELWPRVIIEWVNCLDVLETEIKDLKELEDGRFYRKIIEILAWKSNKDIFDEETIIAKFIRDEYPEFKFDDKTDLGKMENMYIASLFLYHLSQEPTFHHPMCSKLQHETQLKIKTFLEMIIPYQRNITKDTLSDAIRVLENATPKTPVTPRTRALKDFFNSPAVRSAQIHKIKNERNRELMKLRSELEVARYENIDLQEDMAIQQNKIQALQKKLQEKTAELRAIRNEKMKQSTPQSCKKNKNTSDLQLYYKKMVDDLEEQLTNGQCEIEKLELDNQALSKKLACAERQYTVVQEKLEECERQLENLQIQGEVKDRELLNLRMTNEELKMHLSDVSKALVNERSFEVDGVAPLHLSSSLNNSEALSSVIDIQLQDARKESASLKTQVDILSKQLESVTRERDKFAQSNAQLQETRATLKDTETKLNATLEVLSLSHKEIEALQMERASLMSENKNYECLCLSQKESLSQAGESEIALNCEINTLKKEVCVLEESLRNNDENVTILNATIAEGQLQINENLERIQNLIHENKSYKTTIERCNTSLKEIIHCVPGIADLQNNNVDDKTTSELMGYAETLLCNFIKECNSKVAELKLLKNTMEETEIKLKNLQSRRNELEEKDKQNIAEISKLKDSINEKDINFQNLKCEHEKILLDLKRISDKYALLQQEYEDMSGQMQLKDEQVENLLSKVTALDQENELRTRLQLEKESKTEDFIRDLETKSLEMQRSCDQLKIEAGTKEEVVQLLENKLENLKKETLDSESKMKEVIINLQEVRSNQDAVLTTQEKALKETRLRLDELQKEFNESNSALSKQLESEKLLRRDLQNTYAELQLQVYNCTKSTEEMQQVLKRQKEELEASKEYCKTEDTRKLEIVKTCNELENSINNLKLTMKNAASDTKDSDTVILSDNCAKTEDNSKSVVNIIRAAVNEVNASRKLISHLYTININLKTTLQDQKIIVDNYVTKCEEIKMLKDKVRELKSIEQEHGKYLNDLIEHKDVLRDTLRNIVTSREGLDTSLNALQNKWDVALAKFRSVFVTDQTSSMCDELKHVQAVKLDLENALSKYTVRHAQNMKALNTILWQRFLWTERKLNAYSSAKNIQKNTSDSPDKTDNHFSSEKTIIDAELEKDATLRQEIERTEVEIEDFANLVSSFAVNFKSDQATFESKDEQKLQARIQELTEEKSDILSKLDCFRIKNKQLEGRLEELGKKINDRKAETTSLIELQKLKNDVIQLKEDNLKLREERDQLCRRPKQEDLDGQFKEIHGRYELKLEEMKQRMKTAYNEQVAKLNREQEKCLQDKLESLQRKMEQQCRKQADEISKYKAHVSELSSKMWDIGEKLLTEQQYNEQLVKELNQLKEKLQTRNQHKELAAPIEHKSLKYNTRDFTPEDNKEDILRKVAVEESATYDRRCSIRSIQTMGNAFTAEDEEGEICNNTYLADMKAGHCNSTTFNVDVDRLSILQKRNALCQPHLKSSYPAEMQFHPLPFTEEEIKTGSTTEEIFNDSLSQNLLPEEKAKKKNRTQTSYKKPGPPTPSRNGGRLSLQGNEMRSPHSRILRDRNKDRATATPRTLKSLFSSKRQDENSPTPKGRRRSIIFRKYRGANDR